MSESNGMMAPVHIDEINIITCIVGEVDLGNDGEQINKVVESSLLRRPDRTHMNVICC